MSYDLAVWYPSRVLSDKEALEQYHELCDENIAGLDAKKLVEEKKRRYMGIVLDIFYDHKLAQNWNMYSDISLFEFTQSAYRLLQDNNPLLPKVVNRFVVPHMIQEDWLVSYKEMQGFNQAIYRVSRMLSKGSLLLECISDVEENYSTFSAGFEEFFPQLIEYVQRQRINSTPATTEV